MAKKNAPIERDQAITDLEELSDLLSEVGTSLADQDMDTAETDWNVARDKFAELAKNMRDLFNQDIKDTDSDD
jgi:hypothetical protein